MAVTLSERTGSKSLDWLLSPLVSYMTCSPLVVIPVILWVISFLSSSMKVMMSPFFSSFFASPSSGLTAMTDPVMKVGSIEPERTVFI
ncbi:Uncharacterised protein [Mycobacteroides abscessus subsp. abscessus]|nr:Uncharacterised protein [Mycobacteroides abscessus subsp. abscessus]